MITPKFYLDQNDNQVIIHIQAPYTNVKDTEIYVDEDDFRFHSAPYYLRLTLPGKVEETDNSSARYVCDEGKFVITLDKMQPGEYFEQLEMITTMLKPRENKKFKKPLIAVIGDGTATPVDFDMEEEECQIEQTIVEDENQIGLSYSYGFGAAHRGLDSKYEIELNEIAEIQNPDGTSPSERVAKKFAKEKEKFSDDHYLSDLMFSDDIHRLLEFPFEVGSLQKLSERNLETMKNLGNREFLLEKSDHVQLFYGLIDLIYAYCYDWRTSEGSHTVESAWTISRLSGTCAWFVNFSSMKEVVVSSLRRSLSYPLYRHWELSLKVFQDTIATLKSGPVGVLVCLLDMRRIFNEREPFYILNQIYIEDYCVWIQSVTQNTLLGIIATLESTLLKIKKEDLELDLVELEAAARAVHDEEMEDELSATVDNLKF